VITYKSDETHNKVYETRDGVTGYFATTVRPTFAGAVLATELRSERIMSDVWADAHYAIVWNGTAVERVYIGGDGRSLIDAVTIDATDEARAAARGFAIEREAGRLEVCNRHEIDRQTEIANRPGRYMDLRVARGRKVAKGTIGRCFWIGDNGWGESVGLELADGSKVFTASKNCDVVAADLSRVPAVLTRAEALAHAAENVDAAIACGKKSEATVYGWGMRGYSYGVAA
jgi:hypothetical protein